MQKTHKARTESCSVRALAFTVVVWCLQSNHPLIPLNRRKSIFAVEGAEIFSFNHVETSIDEGLHHLDDLRVFNWRVSFRHVATTPVIDGEGFCHSARKHLHATIADDVQLQTACCKRCQFRAQIVDLVLRSLYQSRRVVYYSAKP